MSEVQKKIIVELLEKAEKKYEFVDWITLSSNFLFSGKYALSYKELVNSAWYYKLRKSNYEIPINYLKGVHIVRQDYKELYKSYCRTSNVIFLVDPPYLSTDVSSYSNGGYWNLKDYLNILDVLDSSYFYFTSNKSQIVPLMEWVGTKSTAANPFNNAKKYSVTNGVTHNAKYEDLMYCCNKEEP